MATTFDAVQSLNDNIIKTIEALKINVDYDIPEDIDQIPNSVIPFCRFSYDRDQPEYTRAERQSYRESFYGLEAVVEDSDRRRLMYKMQDIIHKLINGLTVDALNIGDLSASKIVTLVEVTEDGTPEYVGSRVRLPYELMVRYRDEAT